MNYLKFDDLSVCEFYNFLALVVLPVMVIMEIIKMVFLSILFLIKRCWSLHLFC